MGTTITEQPVAALQPGDHAVFCFTTPEERAQVIGPFLHDGLDAGEKIIYIGDAGHRHLPGLRHRQDTDHAAATGQLQVISQTAACRTGNRFDPERMRTVLTREITAAMGHGYQAIRITAEMSWVLSSPDGLARILQCEADFEEAIGHGLPLTAICQLNRNRCRVDQLSALTNAHPIQVTANPEYDDGVLRIIRSHSPDGLRLIGELDAARHDPFLAALTSLGQTKTGIHLDFTHVRFLDLGTLSLLVRHATDTPPDHILVLDNLPPDVTDLIQILGWHHLPGLTHGRSRPPTTDWSD
jgi:anti-anti-sigma regulatory factor